MKSKHIRVGNHAGPFPEVGKNMKKLILIGAVLGALQACSVAKVGTSAAIGAGQLALGAAQVVL